MDVKQIQLWTMGGGLIQYSQTGEDENGPIYTVQDMSAKPHPAASRPATWRDATAQERKAIQIEEVAERLQRNDVLACQSALVDTLLQSGEADGFGVDDIENLYPDPDDWSAEECKRYLDDQCSGEADYPDESNPYSLDRAELVEELESLGIACYDEETDETLADALLDSCTAGDWGDVDDWREAVRDNAEPQEPLEWWLVSQWLAEDFDEIGEPLIRNGYGDWWGRTTSGQSMIMDGTLQQVAARLIERTATARS